MKSEVIAGYFDLTDKIILVTGGSRGLGFEMSRAFAQAGATIVVSSRKQAACERAAELIQRDTGRECLPLACHVGDWEACDQLVETVYERFDRIDVLVNNAGMSPRYESLSTVTRELWDKVIAVNLAGPFRLSALYARRPTYQQVFSLRYYASALIFIALCAAAFRTARRTRVILFGFLCFIVMLLPVSQVFPESTGGGLSSQGM